MSKKIITVIIPTYNRKIKTKTIVNFLKYNSFIKILIVEDGSVESVKNYNSRLAKKYPDIFYFSYKKNKGQSFACNLGIKYTTTSYVWFFDDDDLVHCNSIEKVIKEIQLKKSDGYLLPMHQIYNGVVVNKAFPSCRPHSFNDLRRNGQLVSTSCSIFKTNLIKKIKGWDEHLYGGTDTDLFLRFSKIGRFGFVDCNAVVVDISHPGRLTNKVFRQLGAKINFLKKHWSDLSYKRRFYYVYSMFLLLPLFYGIKNHIKYIYKKNLKSHV
jgi:glycosyltransferase involved in cell wall biosynthesis